MLDQIYTSLMEAEHSTERKGPAILGDETDCSCFIVLKPRRHGLSLEGIQARMTRMVTSLITSHMRHVKGIKCLIWRTDCYKKIELLSEDVCSS